MQKLFKMEQKVIVIDNYDSFTYNLVHAIESITNEPVEVFRNDKVSLKYIDRFECIILSPGPGLPDEAGLLKEIIRTYAESKKILGVCLGLQAIGEVFGSKLINLPKVYHGIQSEIRIVDHDTPLFNEIPHSFDAGRYHSWVIEKETLNTELEITCIDSQDVIMGIKLKGFPVYGVQFHPESIMTPHGPKIIENFLFNC